VTTAGSSGRRFLGLGIPVWIGIAAVVTAAVVGGVMFLGGSDEAAATLPDVGETAAARPINPPVVVPTLIPAETDPAGGDSTTAAEIETAPSTAVPAKAVIADQPPQIKKPTPAPVKTEPVVTPPPKKKATPPAKKAAAKTTATPEPTPAMQEAVVVKPEPARIDPAPQPAAVESREVLAPQEQVVRTAAPVSKPVVQERAKRVLAKPGDLVPLNSVDTQPVQEINVAAKYHPMARKLGQQGTVTLNLLIDETGAVSDVKVVKEIPNSTLNQMAVKAARKWSYSPAIKDGAAVKVWKQVSMDFRL
jgi:protein TonB